MGAVTEFEHVPADISELLAWCVSREPEKRPYQPCDPEFPASPTRPSTWASFVQAWQCCEDGNADWAGVVLTEADGVTVIDLDHCISDTGEPNDLACECMWHWDGAYCEVSKSGHGLHFFLKGTLPHSVTGELIEAYDRARYVVVTGRSLRDPCEPLTALRPGDLEWIEERCGKRKPTGSNGSALSGSDGGIEWDGLVPTIPPTNAMRHTTLVRFAATLRNAGWSPERVEAACVRANSERCEPPLDEKEARRIARWANSKPR